jgi:hypothetical protein
VEGEVTQRRAYPSWNSCRLNSDKQVEWKDWLHISIQEKNTSMKDVNHNRSDQLNRLGPVHVPNGYPFPCFFVSLCPFSPFLYFLMPIFSFPLWIHKENSLIGYSHHSIKPLYWVLVKNDEHRDSFPHIRYLPQQLQFSFPPPPAAFLHHLFPFLTIHFLFHAISINCHTPTAYFLVYAVTIISITSTSVFVTATSASVYQHFWPQNPSILPRTHMELTGILQDSFLHSTWKVISFGLLLLLCPLPL